MPGKETSSRIMTADDLEEELRKESRRKEAAAG